MRASRGACLFFLVATIARKNNLELLCQHLFFRAMGKKQEMHLALANIRTISSTGMCTTYMKTGWRESRQLCHVEKVGKKFYWLPFTYYYIIIFRSEVLNRKLFPTEFYTGFLLSYCILRTELPVKSYCHIT
jgi:hypothetical protein